MEIPKLPFNVKVKNTETQFYDHETGLHVRRGSVATVKGTIGSLTHRALMEGALSLSKEEADEEPELLALPVKPVLTKKVDVPVIKPKKVTDQLKAEIEENKKKTAPGKRGKPPVEKSAAPTDKQESEDLGDAETDDEDEESGEGTEVDDLLNDEND